MADSSLYDIFMSGASAPSDLTTSAQMPLAASSCGSGSVVGYCIVDKPSSCSIGNGTIQAYDCSDHKPTVFPVSIEKAAIANTDNIKSAVLATIDTLSAAAGMGMAMDVTTEGLALSDTTAGVAVQQGTDGVVKAKVKKPRKPRGPKKPKIKKTPADETKKDAVAASPKPQPVPAPAPQAQAPQAAGTETRHSPGYSMLRVERDKLERSRLALIRKNEVRVAQGKAAPTVCSILNDRLIEFYIDVSGQFDARFGKYLRDSKN